MIHLLNFAVFFRKPAQEGGAVGSWWMAPGLFKYVSASSRHWRIQGVCVGSDTSARVLNDVFEIILSALSNISEKEKYIYTIIYYYICLCMCIFYMNSKIS